MFTRYAPDRLELISLIIELLYERIEQLETVLIFLEPIVISHREEKAQNGKYKAYITVQA